LARHLLSRGMVAEFLFGEICCLVPPAVCSSSIARLARYRDGRARVMKDWGLSLSGFYRSARNCRVWMTGLSTATHYMLDNRNCTLPAQRVPSECGQKRRVRRVGRARKVSEATPDRVSSSARTLGLAIPWPRRFTGPYGPLLVRSFALLSVSSLAGFSFHGSSFSC